MAQTRCFNKLKSKAGSIDEFVDSLYYVIVTLI